MRASTSASQACGSISLSLAVVISVAMTAARSAPRSEPANSQDLRPNANPRRARSAALLLRQILPSPMKRANRSQRLSMYSIGSATEAERDRRERCSRSHASSAVRSGALRSLRIRSRSSAARPLMPRSISNRASIRLTASSAIGEIAAAFLPRRVSAAMSCVYRKLKLERSGGEVRQGWRVI
jgi:hypothetical protein